MRIGMKRLLIKPNEPQVAPSGSQWVFEVYQQQ